MIEVKKAEKESSINLIRRFSRRVQQSGLLRRARNLRHKEKPESQLKKKKAALKRERSRKRKEYLWKMGKTDKITNE